MSTTFVNAHIDIDSSLSVVDKHNTNSKNSKSKSYSFRNKKHSDMDGQVVTDCNNTEQRLSLNMEFGDDDLYNEMGAASQGNDNSSLDSIDEIGKMGFQSDRPTSIEKIVNDVLIPPLSGSNENNNSGNEGAGNLHSVSPPLVSDIDLSNISPLSSLQQHPQGSGMNNHPYFSRLDNNEQSRQDGKCVANTNADSNQVVNLEKMKPINISSSARNKSRIHYSNTPNILSSEYGHEYGQKSFQESAVPMVKDDLYYLEYGNRNQRAFGGRNKYFHSFNVNNLNLSINGNGQSPHGHQLTSPHQLSGGGVASHVHGASSLHQHHTPNPHSSHSSSQQTPNTSQTSPITPHSVRTAHTAMHSPHSVHSSHTPHTPHSMNHAFPRFTPYSTQTHAQSANVSDTSSTRYSWQSSAAMVKKQAPQQSPSGALKMADSEARVDENGNDAGKLVVDAAASNNVVDEKEMVTVDENVVNQNNEEMNHQDANGNDNQMMMQQQQQQQQQPPASSVFGGGSVGHSPRSTSSFMTSGPRLNYEEEGLSAADVQEVLSQLDIRPDTLRDSSTDFRPVFSCIRPIVCHKSNTPFYAQCSTAKLGYCTWCRQLRRGNQKQGSICLNCGERLTAKYHRWYPHLVRLEPLEKTRSKSMYKRYKPVFERFGITWHNEKQFDFVIDHYMLMKIYLSTENFNIEPLHLERTYMIGVFAGREFNTGALARKLLREGSKLAMFRADFPDYYDFLRDERAAVAEQMNLRFFQGIYKCYFHAHYTNIEGWYDPSVISRESIIETFKELCNTILAHTALAHINQNQQQQTNGDQTAKSITISGANGNNNNNGRTPNGARKYTKKPNQQKRNQPKQGNHGHSQLQIPSQQQQQQMQQHMQHMQQMQQQQQQMQQQQQQQQQQQNNLISLNGQIQAGPLMNMLPNGMRISPNVFQPNMMDQLNAMNQLGLNGAAGIPPLNLVNVGNGNLQTDDSNNNGNNANNQLLAATQSLLNGIQSVPAPPGMINNPLSQLSVTNMAAITPIAKVKSFQFSTPTTSTPQTGMIRTSSQNQISPSYLPPLATTPRFTVPTPRGAPSTYTAINLNSINNQLSSMGAATSPHGGNPTSSVTMLSGGSNLNIPAAMLKNTNANNNNGKAANQQEKSKKMESDHKGKLADHAKKSGNNEKSGNNNNNDGKDKKNDHKGSLNAAAAPFMLNTNGIISPPISPRNLNMNHNRLPPPPPPQSFAFPPLPQTSNWLPVPPVLAATTPTNAASNPSGNVNGFHMNMNAMNMNHFNGMNMNGMNGNALNKDFMNGLNQNQMNMPMVQNRGSPMFTPTHSPQFRPFSH